MLDVIKEYLVGLGFSTDMNSFNQAQKSVDDLGKKINSFASTSTKQFVTAGTAVSSFLVAANVGIAKFVTGIAKADLENEKFARRMWMNKDAAVAYKDSLSALGANLQDLYLSPELLQRYSQLRQQAGQMTAPKEYSQQMKEIRDVVFEFQRMKLEATYAMRWVGYYLFKYLEKPIGNIKKSLKTLNDNITKTMPQWTQKIAQGLSWIVRLGESAVSIITGLIKIINGLSPATKTAGLAIAGFFGLLNMGPLGWIITGLTTLLLLLDDYNTYKSGGKSLFEKEWKQLDIFMNTMKNNGVLDKFNTSLDGISKSLGHILDYATEIYKKVLNYFGFKDFSDFINQTLITALQSLETSLKGIAGALQTIDGILSGDTSKITSGLNDMFGSIYDTTTSETSEQNIIGAIGNAISGNKDEAKKEVGKLMVSEILENLFPMFKNVKRFANMFDILKNLIVPHADGGIFTTPHLGIVAEAGFGETIIPHDPSKRQNALNLLGQTAGILGAPLTNNSSSSYHYYNFTNSPNYNIYGTEPNATARSIERKEPNYGILLRNLRGAF